MCPVSAGNTSNFHSYSILFYFHLNHDLYAVKGSVKKCALSGFIKLCDDNFVSQHAHEMISSFNNVIMPIFSYFLDRLHFLGYVEKRNMVEQGLSVSSISNG